MNDERRQDPETRDRVDELRTELKAELKSRATRLWRMVVAIGVTTAVALALGGLAIRLIQTSRYDATKRSCLEQNERHDGTIKTLDEQLKVAVALRPKQAKEIQQSRSFTVLLIDALAPRRPSCVKYADDRVGKRP